MRKRNILIIGFGSAGNRHFKILNKKNNVYVISKSKKTRKIFFSSINQVKKIDFEYIIISNETHKHFKTLIELEKFYKNKKILIEKPIFNKIPKNYKPKNTIYVGYNFRFHEIILFIKKFITLKKIYQIDLYCGYDLRKWRKRKYDETYSSNLKKGGGVLFDLSHEIDYANWIFGKPKIIHSQVSKISKLKIKSEDFVFFSAKLKNSIILNTTLNYLSKNKIRIIKIEGSNFTLFANIINNYVKISYKNKTKIIRFKNNSLSLSYKNMHNAILNNKQINVCDYRSGVETLKTIKDIRSKSSDIKNRM